MQIQALFESKLQKAKRLHINRVFKRTHPSITKYTTLVYCYYPYSNPLDYSGNRESGADVSTDAFYFKNDFLNLFSISCVRSMVITPFGSNPLLFAHAITSDNTCTLLGFAPLDYLLICMPHNFHMASLPTFSSNISAASIPTLPSLYKSNII